MLRKIANQKKSDEYRGEIHNLIPGGSHTYSKGDDQFHAIMHAICFGCLANKSSRVFKSKLL